VPKQVRVFQLRNTDNQSKNAERFCNTGPLMRLTHLSTLLRMKHVETKGTIQIQFNGPVSYSLAFCFSRSLCEILMSPRYFHSCLEKDEMNIKTLDYNNFNIRWVKRTNSLQKLMPVPRLIMHKKMPVETV